MGSRGPVRLPAPVLPQQVVDGGGASVDAPQHVPGASLRVPAQGQSVQVGKQTHLKNRGKIKNHR